MLQKAAVDCRRFDCSRKQNGVRASKWTTANRESGTFDSVYVQQRQTAPPLPSLSALRVDGRGQQLISTPPGRLSLRSRTASSPVA